MPGTPPGHDRPDGPTGVTLCIIALPDAARIAIGS
jgi:hypothetical protein